MFNKFVLFSFLLAFKLIESIKSTDICYIKKRECIENYNSKVISFRLKEDPNFFEILQADPKSNLPKSIIPL